MQKKRILSILLLALLLAGMASMALAAERTVTVNNPNPEDRLHLRTSPSEKATSLGKYYNGVNLALLSDPQNGWAQVQIGPLTGYMKTAFLTYGYDQVAVPSQTPIATIRNAGGTGLNLRANQSTSSRTLGLYLNGLKVRVLGVGATWCHVQSVEDGQEGFMLRAQLSPLIAYDGTGTTTAPERPGGGNSAPLPSGSKGIGEWPFTDFDGMVAVNNPNPSDRLHLRSRPSAGGTSLGRYYNGVRMVILGPAQGAWLPVAIGNLSGYMHTDYLRGIGGGLANPVSAMPILTITSPNQGGVHLRAEKSIASQSMGLYPHGTQVTLMGFTDTWAHVIIGNQMGFIMREFLR